MVTTEDLARRSKPVLAEEGLYNWIGRDPHKDPEIELIELRGGLLQRWFGQLQAIEQEETNGQTGQL